MKYIIAYALVLSTFNATSVAAPTWVEDSQKAAQSVQMNDLDFTNRENSLDSARKFLEKAIPAAEKIARTSLSDKADLEQLCSTFDKWMKAYKQSQKNQSEKSKSDNKPNQTTINDSQAPYDRNKFRTEMAKQRQDLEHALSDGKKYADLLSGAIKLRTTIYGNNDPITAGYQTELEKQKLALAGITNLMPLLNAKTPEEMFKKGTTPEPKAVFKSFFSSPITEISDLRGGGFEWLDSDDWIRFKSHKPVILKPMLTVSQKSPPPREEGKNYFIKLCPQDKKALLDSPALKISYGSFLGSRDQWILLSNEKLGIYWFRRWGAH
jgi:hypothetical protein